MDHLRNQSCTENRTTTTKPDPFPSKYLPQKELQTQLNGLLSPNQHPRHLWDLGEGRGRCQGVVKTHGFLPVQVAEASRTRRKGFRVYITEHISIWLYSIGHQIEVYLERFPQHCENFTEKEEIQYPPLQSFVWAIYPYKMSYLPTK